MKIRIVSLASLIFLMHSPASYAEPSLMETTKFIQENLADGDNIINCDNIIIREKYGPKRDRTWVTAMPTKSVRPVAAANIVFECISGECIVMDGEKKNSHGFYTPIDSSRLVSGITHLQKLCGGTKSTPF